jgi:ribosomal protein S18 acetylase RimI-like enzyme
VSEGSGGPLQRPPTARPRAGTGEQAPPTRAELEIIERQLALLPTITGAAATEVAQLRALTITLPGRGPGYNFAACLRWPARESGRLIEALRSHLAGLGEWPTAMVADGLSEPPTLATELAAAGWVEMESERIHVTRRQPGVPHLDAALRLEAVTPRSAAACHALEQQAFGLSDQHAATRSAALAQALERGTLRAYLVRLGGVAVASARLSSADGVAAISGVGVAPLERGKGFGSLVTAVATRAGLAMGNRLVWLSVDERNQPALRLYRRLGYEPSFSWSRWGATAR